jgi:hypothetical protein
MNKLSLMIGRILENPVVFVVLIELHALHRISHHSHALLRRRRTW